jgi:hypothetical protein
MIITIHIQQKRFSESAYVDGDDARYNPDLLKCWPFVNGRRVHSVHNKTCLAGTKDK